MKKLSFIFLFLLLPVAQALEVGDYAEYELTGSSIDTINNGYTGGYKALYRWEIVNEDETYFYIKFKLNINFPEKTIICYQDPEYIEKALDGDFSFVELLSGEYINSLDVVVIEKEEDVPLFYENINIFSASDKIYNREVDIPMPATLEYTFDIKIDKDTREVYDDNGKIGKWNGWINPDKYPLYGETEEIFIENYKGYKVGGSVKYMEIDEEFFDWFSDFEYNYPLKKNYYLAYYKKILAKDNSERDSEEFFDEEGIFPPIGTHFYDPDTGILVFSTTGNFVDDILVKKLDITWLSLLESGKRGIMMQIADTNIDLSSEETKAFNYLYLLPIPIIVGLILIYIVVKKK